MGWAVPTVALPARTKSGVRLQMAPNGHHNADIILCWMFGKKRRARVDHLDQDTSNDVLSRSLNLTWMGFIPTDSHGGWVGGKCGVTAAERLLINSCTIFALWALGHSGINMLVNLWAFTIWLAQTEMLVYIRYELQHARSSSC